MTLPNTHFSTVYRWNGPPVLEVQQARIELQEGKSYIHNRLRMQGGIPGAVIIAESNGDILFVRSFRPAAHAVLLELPRGFGEKTDLPHDKAPAYLASALREFCEETGYVGSSPRFLGEYVTDSAVYPAMVGVVHLQVQDTSHRETPDGEVEDIVWVAQSDVRALVRDGTLRDGHTLSALAFWLFHS